MNEEEVEELSRKFANSINYSVIFTNEQLRFYSGLYPFKILSKNPKDYPEAKEFYHPERVHPKGRYRWVFQALEDFNRGKKGDIVLLPPGPMFRAISQRFYTSKNPVTQELIRKYGKK